MNKAQLISELEFKAIRSGGPGGQHANKVASKVQLSFHVEDSKGLSDLEKRRILNKLKNHISKDGFLQLSSEASRSQHKNKELNIKRFFRILKRALELPKKRIATKPSKAAIEKRLKAKYKTSEKKASRKRPPLD